MVIVIANELQFTKHRQGCIAILMVQKIARPNRKKDNLLCIIKPARAILATMASSHEGSGDSRATSLLVYTKNGCRC